MKRFLIYYVLLSAVLLSGCYGVDEENFDTLAGITIETASDVVNAKTGEVLDYDINIVSDKPYTCEWAYGTPNPSATAVYPIKDKLIYISDKPNIDYTFSKVGTFVLRLKIDNGESVVFKFFTLQVNSGLDEGILVLSNDDAGNSSLDFIKTRTDEEIAADDQEFFPDIIGTINPGVTFTHGEDLYIADKNSEGNYPALVVSTSDQNGSIYSMDPRNFELTKILKVEESFPGVKCLKFAGFSSSSGSRYTLINGTDGAIYRYDLLTNDVAVRTDTRELGVTRVYEGKFDNDFYHFFFKESAIYSPAYAAVDSTRGASSLSDYSIVNMVLKRRGSKELIVITRRKSDNNIVTHKMFPTFTQYAKRLDYVETDPIAIDRNSVMITTLKSSYVYYNYGNKIYRWDYVSPLPTTNSAAVITLPADEEIMTLGKSNDENYLYVGTYNPSRPEKKGSLFIYDFATQTYVKSYEGYFDRPVRILYKYRI